MRRFWTRKASEGYSIESVRNVLDANVVMAEGLPDHDRDRLLELSLELAEHKRWEAAQGFELTEEMVLTIAANACIPILNIGTRAYGQVAAVVVHPSTTVSHGVRSGGGGTLDDAPVPVVGLALPQSGPISLSWDAVLRDSRHPERGHNVVIHEFAHKIDMLDGNADGVPPLRGAALQRWAAVLREEYRMDVDRPSDFVLSSYAWTNPAEFFAVATETFFCRPNALRVAKPELFDELVEIFRQDPRRSESVDVE